MEKFPKLFIKAALIYLLLGALVGVLMAVGWIDAGAFRFVHLHVNLLGFMSMTIFGVAYHILPRFNGKAIPHPDWIPVQFYLMNVGLVGMLIFFIAGGYWEGGIKSLAFGAFSLATAVSILLFVVNIFPILQDPPPVVVAPAKSPEVDSPKVQSVEKKFHADMKVSDALDVSPDIVQIFIEHGFKSLNSPVAKAAFGKMITISEACKTHHVDEEKLLAALNDFSKDSKKPSPELKKSIPISSVPVAKSPPTPPPPDPSGGKSITKGEKCTADVLIGKLIETYPESKKVFEKNYGAGCFNCPGQAYETIAQTAAMHNMDVNVILGEINHEIDKALSA